MRGCLRTMEHILHGETQVGQTGRAWRIRLADTRGYSHETRRCDFRPVAQTETNRFKATTVGSLLRCVHTLQSKLRGCPRRQALLRCALIQIRPGWIRPETRECGVQFFCETRSSDPIHQVHTHTQIYVSPQVSESPLSVAQEQHHSGTCTQEVENIISLEEQSRDSTIEMFWENNKLACPLNYWLVPESATKGVMAAERCKNMLHKYHIYVVKRCMTYICLIILYDIYMLFKNICMLFKNIYMLLKKIMLFSIICCWTEYVV